MDTLCYYNLLINYFKMSNLQASTDHLCIISSDQQFGLSNIIPTPLRICIIRGQEVRVMKISIKNLQHVPADKS